MAARMRDVCADWDRASRSSAFSFSRLRTRILRLPCSMLRTVSSRYAILRGDEMAVLMSPLFSPVALAARDRNFVLSVAPDPYFTSSVNAW